MRCLCAECKILYDVKPPFDQDDESHGLCDECFDFTMHNLEVRRKQVRDQYHKQYHAMEVSQSVSQL